MHASFCLTAHIIINADRFCRVQLKRVVANFKMVKLKDTRGVLLKIERLNLPSAYLIYKLGNISSASLSVSIIVLVSEVLKSTGVGQPNTGLTQYLNDIFL